MRFAKAVAIDLKPFICWNGVANNITELQALGLHDDPLILPENEIPANIYGVCPLKIVDGELEPRTPPEMETLESEWFAIQKIADQSRFVSKLENSADAFFTYLTKDFPINQTARLHYLAIQNTTGKTSYNVLTTEGYVVEIESSNKEDFLEVYFEKLLSLTEPTVVE